MLPSRPTLVFTTGHDAFQLFVVATTFAKATHAAIGVGDYLLHAHDDGVVYEPRSAWFVGRNQRFLEEFEILPDVSRGLQYAYSRVGDRYDHLGVVRIGLAVALRYALSPIRRVGPASENKHTCAGFVMLIDPNGDAIPEWRALDRATVLPADLLKAARNGPSFRRINPAHEV